MHAVTSEAIDLAIEAGFDSIEHATMLSASHIAEMATRRIALVPTMVIRDDILELVKGFGVPADEFGKVEKAVKEQAGMVREAAEAGVLLLAGTDAGMVPHGIIRDEIENFIEAGVSPEVALGAGSWSARKYLGYPGIEEGAYADLVVFGKNPVTHTGILKNPAFIMLDGRQVYPS